MSGQPANGSGQTIAIIDAYNDPNIASELAVFDSTYNLPAPPSLTVVGETGTVLPRTDANWAEEESLDVEWAHAYRAGANIVLVETNSFNVPDLVAGIKTAAAQPGVSVVSMSWGGSEIPYCGLLRPPVHGRRDHLRGRQRRQWPFRRSPVARFVELRRRGRRDDPPGRHRRYL